MSDSSAPMPTVKDAGLYCPKCGHARSRVLYTRAGKGGRLVRRRACRKCGARVTTWERIVGSAEVPGPPLPDRRPVA